MAHRRVSFQDGLEQRGLPVDRAAWYVGCPTIEQFEREVASGIWPAAVAGSRPKRWDREALDIALDRMSGIVRKKGFIRSVDHAPEDSAASGAWEDRARNFVPHGKARA
jgi:hypothetical protein